MQSWGPNCELWSQTFIEIIGVISYAPVCITVAPMTFLTVAPATQFHVHESTVVSFSL